MVRIQRLLLALFLSAVGLCAQAAPYFTTKNGDMIWDEATNLVWARCLLGTEWDGDQCIGQPVIFSIAEARKYAKRENVWTLGGVSDWFFPTKSEFLTLLTCPSYTFDGSVKVCKEHPPAGFAAIDPAAFPNTPIWYHWAPASPSSLYRTKFTDSGRDCLMGCTAYVRLVRSTKMVPGFAHLVFVNRLPDVDWQRAIEDRKIAMQKSEQKAEAQRRKAEEEKKIVAAKREATLKKMIAGGAQQLYVAAGKAQRAGYITVEDFQFYPLELYEAIVNSHPRSEYAAKAMDQLTAMNRSENEARAARDAADAMRQADRNAEKREACLSSLRLCRDRCDSRACIANYCSYSCSD